MGQRRHSKASEQAKALTDARQKPTLGSRDKARRPGTVREQDRKLAACWDGGDREIMVSKHGYQLVDIELRGGKLQSAFFVCFCSHETCWGSTLTT